MEGKFNFIKKETKGCLTRLRKHAPAFIEINNIPINTFSTCTDDSNSKVIPLLSPQILYVDNTIQTQMIQKNGNDDNTINNEVIIWKHPAMDPFQEPLSLCNFLQKQCVIVNNTH